MFQMSSHTQSGHHAFDFWLKFQNGLIVQVVPMVMRNEEVVNFGNILSGIDVAPWIAGCSKFERRSCSIEDRVDQNFLAIDLDKIGRVPEPYQHIAFGIEV